MALAGGAPKRASLTAATRRDLMERLGAGRRPKLSVRATNVFGTPAVEAVHAREVPLGDIDKRLRGVVAIAHEPVLIGSSGGRASVMGVMPHGTDTEAEVRSFVNSLLAHGRIELGKPGKPKRAKGIVAGGGRIGGTTHRIKTVGQEGAAALPLPVRMLPVHLSAGTRCAPACPARDEQDPF